jgi:hypothetical protein
MMGKGRKPTVTATATGDPIASVTRTDGVFGADSDRRAGARVLKQFLGAADSYLNTIKTALSWSS